MGVNDDTSILDDEREKLIKEKFAEVGITVKFKGIRLKKYYGSPSR